jgi:hypothetical protein
MPNHLHVEATEHLDGTKKVHVVFTPSVEAVVEVVEENPYR